jgi:hypothetical protein
LSETNQRLVALLRLLIGLISFPMVADQPAWLSKSNMQAILREALV